ncbi:MAG: DUF3012 domain-containing protein [Alphaproteobacteria bacterium]
MKRPVLKALVALLALSAASACSPEVGSAAWCEKMKEKDRMDWTAREATDFAQHCVLP